MKRSLERTENDYYNYIQKVAFR